MSEETMQGHMMEHAKMRRSGGGGVGGDGDGSGSVGDDRPQEEKGIDDLLKDGVSLLSWPSDHLIPVIYRLLEF